MRQPFLVGSATSAGAAAVEFALVIVLLGALLFPTIDLARAVQANTILINITREGANQASRTSLTAVTSQTILDALGATTPPLNMQTYGAMYITEIEGVVGGDNKLVRQFRWVRGAGAGLVSQINPCASYDAQGSCYFGSGQTTSVMSGALGSGQMIYAVESLYQFTPWTDLPVLGMPSVPRNLYARTIF